MVVLHGIVNQLKIIIVL